MAPVAYAAIAFALLVAAPALATGAEDEGGGGLLLPAINLLILLGVLVYFGRKPVQAFFAERRRAIGGELETAAQLRQQAEERHAKWQRRLADLERELAEIRTTAQERADAERDHILTDARVAAERIRRDASAAIEREVRRAHERLRGEAADLAVELAAGILRERVGADDRQRLVDEFIARVEAQPVRPNGSGS
jgi:F-type H+-transporting ATPase subunit b